MHSNIIVKRNEKETKKDIKLGIDISIFAIGYFHFLAAFPILHQLDNTSFASMALPDYLHRVCVTDTYMYTPWSPFLLIHPAISCFGPHRGMIVPEG